MFAIQKPLLALLAGLLLVTACAMPSTRQATAQALDNILADPHRPAADRARDRYRHPKDTLLFFGIRPEMSVLEVWPEPGWYTDVIAPLVRDRGKYYGAVMQADPASRYVSARLEAYRNKLASDPTLYGNASIVTFPANGGDVVPPGSVDMVVTFRNLHNWIGQGGDDELKGVFKAVYTSLKPGGVLGIEEHRLPEAVPQDAKTSTGYVHESYVIRMAESVGFRLAAKSDINANPNDKADHKSGVWALPPTLANRDQDRARYQAIGESDRMTLKFVKP